jgi:hypothetical protein
VIILFRLALFLTFTAAALVGVEAPADPVPAAALAAAGKTVEAANAARAKATEVAERKYTEEVAKTAATLKAAYQAACKRAMAKGDLATANMLKEEGERCQDLLASPTATSVSALGAPARPAAVKWDAMTEEERSRLVQEAQAMLIKANPQVSRRDFIASDGRRLDLRDLLVPSPGLLRGFPATFVNLDNCRGITEIGFLVGMPIEELHLANLPLRDLRPLLTMPLRMLSIEGNTFVVDFSFLGEDAHLEWLNASRCTQLKDLGKLDGMPLRRLYLDSTQLDSLAALGRAPLQELSISNNGRLESLAGPAQSQIQNLTLSNSTGIKSLKGIDCKSLINLNIGGSCAVPLEELRGLNIQRLTCDGRDDIRSCKGLESLPITYLNASNCTQLSDISALKGLPLQTLYLNRTIIQDLAPVAGTPLTELNLSGAAVSSLTALASCPIRQLTLVDMPGLKSIAPLASLPLVEVTFGNTHVKDMAILNTITSLDRCDWSGWTGGKK